MLDTRRQIQFLLGRLEFRSGKALVKSIICVLIAGIVAFLPEYEGLSEAGTWALFILVLAAGLWMLEAIPAFAVALVVMALEIVILGHPGGVFAKTTKDWQIFMSPWASPLFWLFFGGLVLAEAATKTGVDRWLAEHVLRKLGRHPALLLLGTMMISFVLSMFISNTATAAMMIVLVNPVLFVLKRGDRYGIGLLLAVAFGANLGGMGTLVGTPPNAIAAGLLSEGSGISFARWMVAGLPPAIILALIVWLFLIWRYPCSTGVINFSKVSDEGDVPPHLALWRKMVVISAFILTVTLWLTSSFHSIPTPVASFLPVAIFAATGVLGPEDMRNIHWDVLLLLAGGLSLGLAVSKTGLASWIATQIPIQSIGLVGLGLTLAYLTALLSNFMSNTAAANIFLPIGIAMSQGMELQIAVPMALAASAAMSLPISTPPNAIIFGSGRVMTRDFLVGGILVYILAPVLAFFWCWFLFA
jgi:sodium-dependent dicarboxylate transporter 2/3/5